MDVIFLDLRKAFDSVNHDTLLLKNSMLGITGPLLQWLHCYLFGRTHKESLCSSCFQIRSGVLQGSILGPLLFLIYANDMFSVVSPTKLLLFADDSQCFRRINNPSDCCLLQMDLDNLSDWANRCGMRFNTSKCAYMNFGLESHGYYGLAVA